MLKREKDRWERWVVIESHALHKIYYEACQCNLLLTWISLVRYIIWLRVICIFCNKGGRTGESFWEGYFCYNKTNSSCSLWHIPKCVGWVSVCVWLYASRLIWPDGLTYSDITPLCLCFEFLCHLLPPTNPSALFHTVTSLVSSAASTCSKDKTWDWTNAPHRYKACKHRQSWTEHWWVHFLTTSDPDNHKQLPFAWFSLIIYKKDDRTLQLLETRLWQAVISSKLFLRAQMKS